MYALNKTTIAKNLNNDIGYSNDIYWLISSNQSFYRRTMGNWGAFNYNGPILHVYCLASQPLATPQMQYSYPLSMYVCMYVCM